MPVLPVTTGQDLFISLGTAQITAKVPLPPASLPGGAQRVSGAALIHHSQSDPPTNYHCLALCHNTPAREWRFWTTHRAGSTLNFAFPAASHHPEGLPPSTGVFGVRIPPPSLYPTDLNAEWPLLQLYCSTSRAPGQESRPSERQI